MKILTNRIEGKKANVFVRPNLFSGLKFGTNSGLKQILFFLILILFSTTGFAGEIAKLVLKAKDQGNTFIAVNGLLVANSTYTSQTIQQQVVNPKYFNFNSGVALDLIQNRKQYITITLPGVTATGDLVIDLIATPEADYNFRLKTSSGQEYTGKDVKLVHYGGVVRNHESTSVVFLSVSDEDVSIDISIEDVGEYEIYKDEQENIHVLYNQSDIAQSDPSFACGGYKEVPSGTRGGNPVTKSVESDKCVYLFMEVEYEVFLEAGDLNKLQRRVLTTFNICQWMYKNIGVALKLRELKLWVTPDNYSYNDIWEGKWGLKKADYLDSAIIPTDVNVIHLVTTFYEISGTVGAGGKFRCIGSDMITWPSGASFGGACNFNLCRKHNVKKMAHEIGHSLGSGHTFDCIWNGNCTKLDSPTTNQVEVFDCNGQDSATCDIGPENEEKTWGTVMSYQGEFKYWKGFGEQPGNMIEEFVNSWECLSSCDVSCNDLDDVINVWSFQDVESGDDDYRHSVTATYAHNEIDAGGQASYYSAAQVFLKPGFRAHYGSNFHAAIKPCFYYEVVERKFVSTSNETGSGLNDGEFTVQAYPNPSTGELVIDLTGSSIYKVSLVNLMGVTVYERLNVSSKRIELDLSDKAKGIYFIQVINQSDYVKTIKLVLQ